MTVRVMVQDVMDLRARMAVSGAAALQRQGFLDAAHEILQQYRGSAGSEAAAATAEAELRIALAQVCCFAVRMFEECTVALINRRLRALCKQGKGKQACPVCLFTAIVYLQSNSNADVAL